MFAIVSMLRIYAVEISKQPKFAKETAISKSFKTFNPDIHCVRNVASDNLNYVCHISMMRITRVEIS